MLTVRNVDKDVLRTAPIGMMPSNYNRGDVRRLASERFEATRTTIPAQANKKEKERLEAIIAREEEQFETFKKQLAATESCGGWIAFFYGEPDNFTSVRLRSIADKDFRLIRPTGKAGVFNPISPAEGYPDRTRNLLVSNFGEDGDHMFVFEGEFNQLTFLSQLKRADEALGEPWFETPSCAMGASGDWDHAALKKHTSYPIVCYDNDPAGRKAMTELARSYKRSVLSLKTPDEGSDMDSHIKNLSPDAVYPALESLLLSTRTYLRPIEDVREELNTIRRNENGLDFKTEVEPAVVKTFWRDLRDRGGIFCDGAQVYFFNDSEREVYEIGRNPYWQSFQSRYGLLSEDKLSQQVVASTIQRGMTEGKKVLVHRTAHYDAENHTCYVNLGGHRVAVITPDTIEEADNGDDGVLFLNRTKQPFDINFSALPKLQWGLRAGDTLLSQAFDSKFAVADTHLDSGGCRQLILARVLTMLLAEMSESKPIMVLKGERGSGKTTLCSKVGWLLEGEDFRPTGNDKDVREMETKLISTDLLVLDNVDDLGNREGATLDLLCRSASGGEVTRRKLYADANVNLNFRMTAHVWVSTRTNPLDRPDLADRQILIPLERYTHDGKSERDIKSAFLAQRNAMMAELLVRLQMVLGSLERQENARFSTAFRMRDFAFFCLRVAKDEGWGEEMADMLDSTVGDQNVTITDGNLLIEVIRLLIGHRAKRIRETVWSLTATELRIEILEILFKLHIQHHAWQNPRQLAEAIKREPSVMRELGLKRILDKKTKTYRYYFEPSAEVLAAAIAEWRSRVLDPYDLDDEPGSDVQTSIQ